jgi:hypothetical protein
MRVGDARASTLAAAMAQAEATAQAEAMAPPEDQVTGGAGALRAETMRALQEAKAAHAPLVEALQALVEDGTDMSLEDDPYPDDVVAFDLIRGIAIAHSQLEKWLASLQGRASLERMTRDSRSFARRIMLAADGHVWEMSSWPKTTVFDPGVRASYEREHGELLEVELFPVNPAEPDGLHHARCGELELLTVAPPQWKELHALIVAERAKAAGPVGEQHRDRVQLIDVRSGERYNVNEHGTLRSGGRLWMTEWPVAPLHQLFLRNSPEPGREVVKLWTVGPNGLTSTGAPVWRIVRDRRDHDADLWSFTEDGSDPVVWSHLSSQFELVDNKEFVRPSHD